MILGHLSHKGCVVLLSGDNAHLTEPTLIRRKQMNDKELAATLRTAAQSVDNIALKMLLQMAADRIEGESK